MTIPCRADLVARFDAGTLTVEQTVVQYARARRIDQTSAAQIVALALGADWLEGYDDQLRPIPAREA